MRRVLVCLSALILTVSLAGCNTFNGIFGLSKGSTKKQISVEEGKSTSIDFKGWSVVFSEPVVFWSESLNTDLLVLKATATNNTGKASSFATVNNVWAYQKDSGSNLEIYEQSDSEKLQNTRQEEASKDSAKNAAAAVLSKSNVLTESDVSPDGNIYQDLEAADNEIQNGESIDLRYVWKLWGNYKDINVDVLAYSPSNDDVTLDLGDLRDTEEHAQYTAIQQAAKASNNNGTEVTIRGATIGKPEGWKFTNVRTSFVSLLPEDSKDTATAATVSVKFITTADSARDRAIKYAANYKIEESAVASAVIGGVEWFYFSPSASQFQAYAQATDGVINVGSDTVRWDDAQVIMNNVTIH